VTGHGDRLKTAGVRWHREQSPTHQSTILIGEGVGRGESQGGRGVNREQPRHLPRKPPGRRPLRKRRIQKLRPTVCSTGGLLRRTWSPRIAYLESGLVIKGGKNSRLDPFSGAVMSRRPGGDFLRKNRKGRGCGANRGKFACSQKATKLRQPGIPADNGGMVLKPKGGGS